MAFLLFLRRKGDIHVQIDARLHLNAQDTLKTFPLYSCHKYDERFKELQPLSHIGSFIKKPAVTG